MFKVKYPYHMILGISMISFFSISCKSQLLLPTSDLDEIQKNKSILSAYTCEDLTEKAMDQTFALKGLAAIRAIARCKDFKYDLTQLSDFERKLYSSELNSLDATKGENTSAPTPSISELKNKIKAEKNAIQKLKLYKQLRLSQKRSLDRKAYLKTSFAAYKWAMDNFKSSIKSNIKLSTKSSTKSNIKTNTKPEQDTDEAAAVLIEAAQMATKTYWTENDSKKSFTILNEVIEVLNPNIDQNLDSSDEDSKNNDLADKSESESESKAESKTKAKTKTKSKSKALVQEKSKPKIKAKEYSIAELLLLKGRILDESKKPNEAIEHYDLAIADIKKYSPKNLSFSMDYLLWQKAWILYKEKNYTDAEKAFSDLAATTTDLSEKSRALFYQARSMKFLGNEEPAKLILESVTQNDFFGYYGLVSYYELGKKFPALKSIKQTNILKYDLNLTFLKIPEKNIFTDLVKYREFNLAEKAVDLLASSKEDQINIGLHLAQNNRLYMTLFRAFAKLSNDEKVDVFISYPNLIFPQPYEEHVSDMASKTNLPKSLIYSIMKQESAFNEKAHSPANAMGLMQVIPKLATRLSKKFEIPYTKTQDLYDPTINIQLGSFELMEQVKRQNGQLAYVAAAYNAGPGALANWLKNRKRDDMLEFIEEIPYDETRTYVKLIMRNKLFYERISDRDSEHDFPTDFLNSN